MLLLKVASTSLILFKWVCVCFTILMHTSYLSLLFGHETFGGISPLPNLGIYLELSNIDGRFVEVYLLTCIFRLQ
jgi:hypothetical protein